MPQQLRQFDNAESSGTAAINTTDGKQQTRTTKATTGTAALTRAGLTKAPANLVPDAAKSTRNKQASTGSTDCKTDTNGAGGEREITTANNTNPTRQLDGGIYVQATQTRATKPGNNTNTSGKAEAEHYSRLTL